MAEFTEQSLEKRLSNLTNSDYIMKHLSMWIISHRSHFKVICETFYKVLVKTTNKDKTILYLYLIHEIVLSSKKKHPEFIIEFGHLMKKILEFLIESNYLDEKTKSQVWDLITKWRRYQLFDVKKQNHFENLWKEYIGARGNTLKRENTDTNSENKLKNSKLGKNVYCLLCQKYGHETNPSCALCRHCGTKGHVRENCPKFGTKLKTEGNGDYVKMENNFVKEQKWSPCYQGDDSSDDEVILVEDCGNVRPKIEEKVQLNENHMEVNNNSKDDEDVIIVEEKVGGPTVTIVTLDEKQDDEVKYENDLVKNISQKQHCKSCECELRETGKNELNVDQNDARIGKLDSGDSTSQKEEVNDERHCVVTRKDSSEETQGFNIEVEQSSSQESSKFEKVNNNNTEGSNIAIIVDVFKNHQDEANVNIKKMRMGENSEINDFSNELPQKSDESNEINDFSNVVFGNSFPEKSDQEYVEVEQCKSDNSYVPPYNDSQQILTSVKTETPEMNMRSPKKSRIYQKHNSNAREKRSSVVMVYSTTPEKMNCNVLFNLFCQYGNVNRVVFMKKRPGNAMLEMEDSESAKRAIHHLHFVQVFGCRIRLESSRSYQTLADMKNSFPLPDGSPALKDYYGQCNNNLGQAFNPPSKCLRFKNLPKMEKDKIDRLFLDNGASPPSRMKWFLPKWENSPSDSDMGLMEFTFTEESSEALALVNNVQVISYQVGHMSTNVLKLSFAPPTY